MKPGDAIAAIATPIARAIGADCIDPETRQLRPESTCNQIREAANQGRYADAFYQFIFRKPRQQNQTNGDTPMAEEKLHYLIQIDVEAEDVVEALRKKNEGKVISINPKPNPKSPIPTQPTIMRSGVPAVQPSKPG